MSAPSAKPLFRAMKRKPSAADVGQGVLGDFPEARAPERPEIRRKDDAYLTGQVDPIRALLARDGGRIRECGRVWENAVGEGHLAREIDAFGLPVIGSDLVDRGFPGLIHRSFYDFDASLARAIISNPPFCEINARDGHGRWLRHLLDMPGWDYLALLLSWDWPAARINGLGEMLDSDPFSWCYLMRWKLDFTGEGSPPQRNAWFVWDRNDRRGYGAGQREPSFRFMDKHDWRQPQLIGGEA